MRMGRYSSDIYTHNVIGCDSVAMAAWRGFKYISVNIIKLPK